MDSLSKETNKKESTTVVELYHGYLSDNKASFVRVFQETTWEVDTQNAQYVLQNPQEAISKANSRDTSFPRYHFFPDTIEGTSFYIMSLPANNSVNSSLRCYDWDETRRTCVYFGSYEHWFTQIWFFSAGDEKYLTDELMYELISKAVNIIIEASPPVK